MTARARLRVRISFREVNRRDTPGYDPGLQRHHLLSSQLLSQASFGRLFEALDPGAIGFDDFRRNGLLLPAREKAALRLGLPLHRGPHRSYNAMVAERVGQIEGSWAARRVREPEDALEEAFMRLALLQSALRRRLLETDKRRLRLNRFDPLGVDRDFTQIDAMAEMLWGSTEVITAPLLPEMRPANTKVQ